MRVAGVLAVAAAAFWGAAAFGQGQVLYKLIDRAGKVTYSDSVPKNFDGQVVKIEADASPTVSPAGKPPPVPVLRPLEPDSPRVVARDALAKALREAQDRVEVARKAKSDGEAPLPEEMQTVQRRYAPLKAGETPPRPNCFASTDPHGQSSMICPMQVPKEAYYERLKALDEALKVAEADLASAERAYRRGTD